MTPESFQWNFPVSRCMWYETKRRAPRPFLDPDGRTTRRFGMIQFIVLHALPFHRRRLLVEHPKRRKVQFISWLGISRKSTIVLPYLQYPAATSSARRLGISALLCQQIGQWSVPRWRFHFLHVLCPEVHCIMWEVRHDITTHTHTAGRHIPIKSAAETEVQVASTISNRCAKNWNIEGCDVIISVHSKYTVSYFLI